jgi:hypothetical protein
VKPFDIAVMMWHLQLAAKDPDIGHNDADFDLKTLCALMRTKQPCRINTIAIESALYSCNLMDEAGKFWHPEGKSFDEFLKDMVFVSRQHGNYDRFYNFFEAKKESSK